MERKEQPGTKQDDDIEKGPGTGRDPEIENPGSKDWQKKDKQQPEEQAPAEDEQEKE